LHGVFFRKVSFLLSIVNSAIAIPLFIFFIFLGTQSISTMLVKIITTNSRSTTNNSSATSDTYIFASG
jgi:hypothetical protein